MRRYPVHWDVIFGLTAHLRSGRPARVDHIARQFARRMDPPARVSGFEHLPHSPRFVLAANHYQRPGLWIFHPASVLTDAIERHYGLGNPPVRWIVTANWPPLRLGPFVLRNPGDWLLPRVARALCAYPVPFSGSDPVRAARSLRRLLEDARTLDRPIGLFPEGVAGTAGKLAPPLPGVNRLLVHLARAGFAVVPAGISEQESLIVRFGEPLSPAEVASAAEPATVVMHRIAGLAGAEL